MLRRAGGGRRTAVEAAAFAVLVALPFTASDPFLVDQLGKFLLFAVFALSVDFVWGFGGMFVLGQAVFFGCSGYVVAMLTVNDAGVLPLSFWTALPIAVLAAALLALALGLFVFSNRRALVGAEFAVVTLAGAVMAERLANAGGGLTGGQNGLLLSTQMSIGGTSLQADHAFYAFAATLLVAVYALLRWVIASPAGLVLRSIRANELRVGLLGYNVAAIKLWAFVLSGAVAGLAGAVFYAHEGIVSPGAVGVQLSIQVLLWVALGGRGTLIGPAVGAVALSYLSSRLSGAFLNTWLLIVGLVLVVVIVAFPGGVFGFLNRSRPRRVAT